MARVWIEDRASHKEFKEALAKAKAAKRQPPGRWRVRWYDMGGKARSKTFARKPEAEHHVHQVEARLRDGTYRDASAGKATLAEVAEKWRATLSGLEPTTRETYEDTLRVHVLPRWGSYQVRGIEWEDVAEWVGQLVAGTAGHHRPLSPGRVGKIHQVLSLVLGHAVRAKRIPANPAAGVPLPRPVPRDHVYLTHGQVERLADAAGPYRVLVLLAAYTGLRWGELSAVTVGAVDLGARRVSVRQAYKKTRGGLVVGMPKTHERRKVPILRSLADELAPHVDGRKSDELLFTAPRGGPLYGDNFRSRFFTPAVKAAGLGDLGVTPHKLRHTAASLAIASGADVKVVQTMLGHKSAVMTLDLYGHLFPDRLDEVANRLDRERERRTALQRIANALLAEQRRLEDPRSRLRLIEGGGEAPPRSNVYGIRTAKP
ncbi:site-specific integrase [Streptomyces sp. DSM 41972]|uniref:Site-specific integrase n=1 Tax=Streptomyces althioticus subsp. attaecolombicae TaxID=3075534 RepID=A0ABU3HW13_9ACTN|nr:site-specific integrase [Streptomyces sp. DSM 41972]SCD67504.1 Site-specific recombinase XerD [Streptomyces sp. di50b]SCD75580.1 Site-specific recombinase XerD [Streptomyces sp. di188]